MRHAPLLGLLGLLALQSCENEKETVVMVPVANPTPIPGLGTFWHQALASTAAPGPNQFPRRGGHVTLLHGGKLWVIGGRNGVTDMNDAWNSTDGVSWTQVLTDNAAPGPNQFSRRYAATGVSYAGAMWVVGGETVPNFRNDVWKSTDGVTWTNVLADTGAPGPNQFPRRRYHAMTVHAGAMWVSCGQLAASDANDVWKSTDGVTWTSVLADTASPGPSQFSQREGPAILSDGGALWLFGGVDGSLRNDVWNSIDGTAWTKVLADTATPGPEQFPRRTLGSTLAYDGRMWVIGGSGASYLSDVWSSPDGIHWEQAAASAAFPGRLTFGALVHDNLIWVIGGESNVAGPYRNDVWYSP